MPRDPRWFQIAALSSLILFGTLSLGFELDPAIVLVTRVGWLVIFACPCLFGSWIRLQSSGCSVVGGRLICFFCECFCLLCKRRALAALLGFLAIIDSCSAGSGTGRQ